MGRDARSPLRVVFACPPSIMYCMKRSAGLILGLISLILYGIYMLLVNQMFQVGRMYDKHILFMAVSFILAIVGLIVSLRQLRKIPGKDGLLVAGIVLCDISIIINIIFPISTLVNMWVDIVIRNFE